MIPVDQTIMTVPGGNCLPACIASLLEVPLDEVPNFCAKKDWQAELNSWLEPRGYYAVCFTLADVDWRPHGLYILAGQSPRGDWLHAVVARGESIVHDPHPSRAGVLSHHDATLIIPLDPKHRGAT